MARKKYRPGKKVRISGVVEKLIIAGLILCCVVVLFFCTFAVLKSVGKNSLKKHASEVASTELSNQLNDEIENIDEPLELEEGQILVEGEVYEYNDDIMTFLCMGVDSRSGIEKEKTFSYFNFNCGFCYRVYLLYHRRARNRRVRICGNARYKRQGNNIR